MGSMAETAACLIECEIRDKVKELTKAEDVLRVAFKAANNHWMFTDEDVQFKGALGAAMIALKGTPEYDRLEASVRALGRVNVMLNALQQGVPVDFEKMESPPADTIPLTKMWRDRIPA